MQKEHKQLIKKRMLAYALGYHPALDPVNFATVILLGYSPALIAEITNRPERSVRRWTNGERKMPPDFRRQLQQIVRRSAMALRKSTYAHAKRLKTQHRRQLQKTIVDLAMYLELVYVLPDPDTFREKSRERYRDKIRASGREPRVYARGDARSKTY